MRWLGIIALLCLLGCQGGKPVVDTPLHYDIGEIQMAVTTSSPDEQLNYDEPWGWMEPARHALGALLTEQGRYREAITVYEANLARYPENGWALHGLAEALRGVGKTDEAKAVQARFDAAWNDSKVKLIGSCFCRTIPEKAGT
jgi:tetratricopeptide (TPR) repeat protein